LRQVKVVDAVAGMVLAQGVENGEGVLIAGPGAKLNEKALRRFEQMLIDSIFVEEDPALQQAEAEKRTNQIEKRFALAGDSPIWQELKAFLIERIEHQIG
jgi:hypothetical protein